MPHTSLAVAPLPAPQSLTTLPPPSRFGAYCAAVNAVPMLDEGEETRLARAWRDRGDRQAAWQLTLSHLRMVPAAVRRHDGYGVPREDLVQEGTIGLMKAVKRFEPGRGARLAGYAMAWIEAAIKAYILRNLRLVRLGTSSAMKKLFFGYRGAVARIEAGADGGGEDGRRDVRATAQAIAGYMGLTRAQVEQAEAFFNGGEAALDSVPEWLLGSTAGPLDAALAGESEAQASATGQRALAALDARERAIVGRRILAEDKEGLARIGQDFGISAERVRQIEARALRKMRAAVTDTDVGGADTA